MYSARKSLYEKLEKERSSKIIVYITGDRPGLEAQIAPDVLDLFAHHLDSFLDKDGNIPNKISLWLYSRGVLLLRDGALPIFFASFVLGKNIL